MSQAKLLNTKITKGQVDDAIAAGITHAKFRNKGVQKRLLKNRAKVQREQDRREAHFKLVNKRTQAVREAATAEITETVSTAAKAPEVVNEGVAGLMGLLGGGIPAGHELIHDVPHREALHHEHIASLSVSMDPHPVVTEGGLHFGSDTRMMTPYRAVEFGKRGVAGRYPLNLYGDEHNYKPFPNIGDVVREDGVLMALPAEPNEKGELRPVDPVTDKLVYAEPGSTVTEETLAKLMGVSDLSPFADTSGGQRAQMFSGILKELPKGSMQLHNGKPLEEGESVEFKVEFAYRPDHKLDPILEKAHRQITGGIPAGQVFSVLGDAKPAEVEASISVDFVRDDKPTDFEKFLKEDGRYNPHPNDD